MCVLERASDELDEGFHTAVHHEQADVRRLVVHANPHKLWVAFDRHWKLVAVGNDDDPSIHPYWKLVAVGNDDDPSIHPCARKGKARQGPATITRNGDRQGVFAAAVYAAARREGEGDKRPSAKCARMK